MTLKMTKDDNTAYPTVKDGLRYLTAQGWQISKKTLYRHIEQEKISKNPWSREALDVYAVQFLNPRVDIIPTKKGRQLDPGPAAALLAAREEKIRVDIEAKKFELQIRRGQFVLKDTCDQALARRAMIFRSDLTNFSRGKATEICEKVHGDRQYLSDLIQFLGDEFEDLLGRYSGSTANKGRRDFDVEEKKRVARDREFNAEKSAER